MVLLTQSIWFATLPGPLSIGITVDLALTVPLVYIALIWKTKIPKITAVPFLTGGLIIATYILPEGRQSFLDQFKIWVIPVIELGVFSFVIYNVRAIYKSYQSHKDQTFDFYSAIRASVKEILPTPVQTFFAMEISTFYYGFFNWKSRKLNKGEFSYHKESGTIAILAVIILLVVVETGVFHLVIQRWSPVVAWVLTILSIYSGVQIFGMLRSLNKRPIIIENGLLKLRFGIMAESTILLDNIEDIELTSREVEINEQTRKLSPLGEIDSHNILIHLKNEGELFGLYGIKKTYKTIALHVDAKNEFEQELQNALIHRGDS